MSSMPQAQSRWLAALALALGTAAAPASLVAQASPEADGGDDDPRAHRGVWLSGGLGVGADGEGDAGVGAYFRLGGTLSENLVLGGEVLGMAREEDEDLTVSRGNTTATLLVYPDATGGLFLKGGLGFSSAQATTTRGDVTVTASDEGFGATLGAGYDIQLGDGNLFLTPNGDILFQEVDDWSPVFLLTVGIGMR